MVDDGGIYCYYRKSGDYFIKCFFVVHAGSLNHGALSTSLSRANRSRTYFKRKKKKKKRRRKEKKFAFENWSKIGGPSFNFLSESHTERKLRGSFHSLIRHLLLVQLQFARSYYSPLLPFVRGKSHKLVRRCIDQPFRKEIKYFITRQFCPIQIFIGTMKNSNDKF